MENHTPEQTMEYGPTVSTQTLTKDELITLIYQDKSVPQDTRFSNEYNDNRSAFHFFDVRDLINPRDRTTAVYPIVKLDEVIIGIAKLEEKENNTYLVKYVSVDESYQDRKFSSKLLNEIMHFIKSQSGVIEITSYTGAGMKKLMAKFHQLAQEYQIKIIDAKKSL